MLSDSTSGKTAVNCKEKADLNSYFATCFNTSYPPLNPPVSRQLVPNEDLLCSKEDVYHLLISLNVTKSSGPDDVSPHMLKYTATSISSSVTMLFNMSLSLGCVPLQ